MGREVRRVPKNWEHPKYEDGQYKPLLKECFRKANEDWEEGKLKWEGEGLEYSYMDETWTPLTEEQKKYSYEEYHGERPDPKYHMPEWAEEEKTHLQMYETTSEGTPISPVMETPEELARWLADNKASAFAGMTASYESWLSTIKRGFAPSAIFVAGQGLKSGVEGL